MYLFIPHLGSVEHSFWLEHHTHERRSYTARDHSYRSDTSPCPQKGKQPCWDGLRNSITIPKGKQLDGNTTLHLNILKQK